MKGYPGHQKQIEHLEKDLKFKFAKPRYIVGADGTVIMPGEELSDYSEYEKKSRATYYTAKSTQKKLQEIRARHGLSPPPSS